MFSDQQLMQQISEGSHTAFADLVSRHTQRFLNLAYRVLQNMGDAEDIVQTAFIRLWQRPDAWNAHKSQFTTWFYRVVLNACHDFQRKHGRQILMEAADLEPMQNSVSSEEVLLQERQISARKEAFLQAEIAKLPSSQRDALNLVVYCALPQKQAAEVLGISLKALEALLGRARRKLVQSFAIMDANGTSEDIADSAELSV